MIDVERLPCKTKAAPKSRAWSTGVRRKPNYRVRQALEAHDRAQAASDRIRRRAGKPPLPENGIVCAWREQVAGARR